jgi:PAS domain S-box-containing protein
MFDNPVQPGNAMPFVQGISSANVLEDNDILRLLPFAIYVCDASGVVKKYNEQAVELWGGHPVDNSDGQFLPACTLYAPNGAYLPYEESPVAACLKDGLHRKDVEMILEREDLSRIHIKADIVPAVNANGVHTGVIVCMRDITHEKATEYEIKSRTLELEDYFENACIGLHWVDANGIIKWANKAELALLGYTKEEYIGRHISEFHVHQEKIGDILNRLKAGEILNQYESELRCKDGSIRIVHINSSVYREGDRFVHTRCFTVDVTELKQAELALKESERRYRELIQTLQTPLYTTDAEGRITLYNKAAVDLWGRVPEIGTDLWCGSYKIMNTEGGPLPLEECPMAVCLKEQRPVYNEHILVVRPDGSIRNVAPHPQPVFDGTGKMIGAVNMLIDITFIKSVETALRESETKYRNLANSLEEKVIEKTQDLINKTNELKLSQRKLKQYLARLKFQNEELEQFTYAASHDMKEPLRKIHLYNGFIADNPANQLDARSKEYLKRSIQAVERMKNLIEDLLSYSRITSNVDSYEEVNLDKIVEEITMVHGEELEQNNLCIVSESLGIITGVPFQIKQLMLNLVDNSIKYRHPERNGVISIKRELIPGTDIIGYDAEPHALYHKLSVEDNGIGFDSQYAQKIFEIFQRLNNVSGVKGAGIGLAICKKIVQNHRGFIRGEGMPNEGAAFFIYIPETPSVFSAKA